MLRLVGWIEQIFSSGVTDRIALAEQFAAFLRVVTNPRLPGKRFTPQEGAELVDRWLEQPNVRFVGTLVINIGSCCRQTSA